MADDDSGRSALFWVAVAIGGVMSVIAIGAIIFLGIPVFTTFLLGTGEPPSESTSPPMTSFAVNGTTIEHDGGDDINATRLAVEVDRDVVGTWSELSDGDDTVTGGDAITVSNVEDGDEIILIWRGPDGSTPLLRHTYYESE